MKTFVQISLTWLSVFAIAACGKSFEANKVTEEEADINEAQVCLDSMDQALAGAANVDDIVDACLEPIKDNETRKAMGLKCSAENFRNGLNNARFENAYDILANAPDGQKMANYLKELAVSSTAGADDIYEACNASKDSNLIYMATLVKIGTYMEAATAGPGTPATLADDCLADTTNCSSKEMNDILVDTTSLYCQRGNLNSAFCEAMNNDNISRASGDNGVIVEFLNTINF